MKILAFTKYGQLGASTRLRLLQYVPLLKSEGHQVTAIPLFDDSYVSNLQKGKRNFINIFVAYSQRLSRMLAPKDADLIWIEKECLPWIPDIIERFCWFTNLPTVLDYDDAVFHLYDQHQNFIVKKFLSNKHPRLISESSLVIVGNKYLADFASKFNSRRVEILPTVVDLNRYPYLSNRSRPINQSLTIGWIGQNDSAVNLRLLSRVFKRLKRDYLVNFLAIGIDPQAFGLPMTGIEWAEETEVQQLYGVDIGIMPLQNAPFQRGKCGYKLIQYMACSLPVVASPVGINTTLVKHGVNGFLAESEEQWYVALGQLLKDACLRYRMGQAGRKMVERDYCIRVSGPKLVSLLEEAATSGAVR